MPFVVFPRWLNGDKRRLGPLGQEDPLEEEVATYSSILAWKFHGQRNLVGYSPWVCKSVRYDWVTKTTIKIPFMNWIKYNSLFVLFMRKLGVMSLRYLWSTPFSDLYLKCYKLNSFIFLIILDAERKQVLGSKFLQDQKRQHQNTLFYNKSIWLGKKREKGRRELYDQIL